MTKDTTTVHLQQFISKKTWRLPFKILLGTLLMLFSGPLFASGAPCPARIATVPERTIGAVWNMAYDVYGPVPNVSALPPTQFFTTCCARGRIVKWNITTTKQFGFPGQVNATCSDGTTISSLIFGTNGNETCDNTQVNPPQLLYQPDDEGVFTFEANSYKSWMRSFLGVGDGSTGSQTGAVSCPKGSRPIGIGARSACYALSDIKVVCANTNDTQDNVGGALDASDQCGNYIAQPLSSDPPLGSPYAWVVTPNALESRAASPAQVDCCKPGEAISRWTVAPSSYQVEGRLGFFGYLRGQCTDGTILQPIVHGYNIPNDTLACNNRFMLREFQYNTPANGKFPYRNSSVINQGTLNSFMIPDYSLPAAMNNLTCPPGLSVVGYSAQSACLSLAALQILCGNISQYTTSQLQNQSTPVLFPLPDAQDGSCSSSANLVPNTTYYDTNGMPIGKIGRWVLPYVPNKFGISEDIVSANAGPLTTACCPLGQGIIGFNIWPTANPQHLVGKISGICTDGQTTRNTSEIAYGGFNGTYLNGTVSKCNDTLRSMKTRWLVNRGWNITASNMFESLLGVPSRTTGDYGNLTGMGFFNQCPDGQYPIGFTARGACLGLVDFMVSCGLNSNLQGLSGFSSVDRPSSSGSGSKISEGTIAAIVVGSAVGLAFIAAIGIFLFCRYRKRTLPIDSIDLFNLSRTGVSHRGTASRKEGVSMGVSSYGTSRQSTRSTKTQLMGIGRFEHAKSTKLDGILPAWEIQPGEIKLHHIDGKPVELGRGGFGVVLWGQVHREDAAIKVIARAGHEADMLKEIANLERAKTKFVVRFLGYCISSDGILLAMEYMRGGNLYDAIQKGPRFQWKNWGRSAFTDICKGLYMLHSNQIAHLDMKSLNVLIADDGTCKLSDLGMGRLLKQDQTSETAELRGSIPWVAPEILLGRCCLASDIWSLSTILWEICTLQKATRAACVEDIQVPEEAPQEVADLMRSCRAPQPQDRPTIGEVCNILDSILYE